MKHILEQGFFEKPNYSHWIYKNRSGRNNCIIWTIMDLGTMREKSLFVTDTDYNLISDIDMIEITYDENETEAQQTGEFFEDKVEESTPPPSYEEQVNALDF